MGDEPLIGAVYRHHKHREGRQYYRIVQIALHTETDERLVIYQDTESPEKVFARPVAMFMEHVEWQGETVPRFALQQEAA